MLHHILDGARKDLLRDVRRQLGELRVSLVRAGAPEEEQKALGRSITQLDELFLLVVGGGFNGGKRAGANAVVRGHEALTRDFVPRSDLVLFVTSADRPFTESERAFLETIRDWGKKVVIVLNKIDLFQTREELDQVVSFIGENSRALLGITPEIFPA